MKTIGKLLVFSFTCLVLAAGAYEADGGPLFEAIKKGDKAEVEALLAKGAEVNAKNQSGETPLHSAAYWGKKDIVELLLAKGVDVNAKDKYGKTPLDWTAYLGQKEIVELLLAKGADVNAKNQVGETPLHSAAQWGKKDVTELLLDNGADINAKNTTGKTPLYLALARGKKDVAELLERVMLKAMGNPRAEFEQLTSRLHKDSPINNPLKTPTDAVLTRRLIIKLASEIRPAPAIPEEARKHFIEGTTIVKAAKNPAQQALAAQSFIEALKVAPWWGDAYYNLGIAQELAEKYDEAEQAFNFYLLSNPKATEKREVQDRIYALSAKRKLLDPK